MKTEALMKNSVTERGRKPEPSVLPAMAEKIATPSAPPVCLLVLLAPDAIPGERGVDASAAETIAGVRMPSPAPHTAKEDSSTM